MRPAFLFEKVNSMTSPTPASHIKKIGFWMCLAVVMGNMIGSGVFLLPASLAPFGWNAVAGWIVTIGGALCLAHVLARLTAHFPNARGLSGLIDESLGPVAGILIAFSYWVSVWTGVVTITVGGVSYASSLIPVLAKHSTIAVLAAIWILTLVNIIGVRAAGTVQAVTMILKLIPLVIVGFLVVAIFGREGTASLAPYPAEGLGLASVNAAAALTLWAMIGFEAAGAVSDKVETPEVNVPRATFWGALLTGVIYLVVCSGIALMLPADEVAQSAAPFELFVRHFWSPDVAPWIALFAAISAFGATNGWILVQGEVPLDMARRKLLPHWFAGTNDHGTPIRALIVSSIFASILVLANSSKTTAGLFSFMALLSTSATLWLYLACTISAFRHKVALPTAIIGLPFCLWSLWGAGWQVSLLSIALSLAGLPLYWWAKRERDVPAAA